MDRQKNERDVAETTGEQISQGGSHGVSPSAPQRKRARQKRAVGEAPVKERPADEPEATETTAAAPNAGPSS